MSDNLPVVSVVLAARNEETRIGRAIESILLQTLDAWELIVVDDGSRDKTGSVARSFTDPRVHVVTTPARGLAPALNSGIARARGPFVARQDADDLSLPHRLERQVAFLEERPDVAVVGSRWRELGPHGRPVRPRTRFVAGRVNDVLPSFNPLMHAAVVFRKAVFERIGGYDETLRFAQDYDLWFRLAHAGETLWNLPDLLAVRTMTGANVAARHERAQVLVELRVRRRDLGRRRRAGLPIGWQVWRLAQRALVALVPLRLKRSVRARRRKA